MAGKRIAAPEETAEVKRKRSRRAIWIAGAVLAVLVAAWAGLCLYAGGYGGVFPGVTMAGEDLGGLSLDHAEEQLSEALEGFLTGRVVAVAADGEDLGTYDLAELGAYAVAGEAAQAAWDVGRESGVLGWLKNGWTMLRGLLGGETALEPRVYYDEDRLSAAVEEMAGAFDQEPVDASYELTRDGLFATRERDGRALDREGLAQALMSAPETVEAPWETVEAQALDLEAMADSFSSEPSQARYDKETGQVVDGEVGVTVDAEAARLVLESAAAGETVQLPADITFPEMTAQELEAVLFRDLLGTTTTNVSGSSTRRNNVRLSGEAVNGTILNDGEEFDYNKVVGERTVERGYGAAATYVNGETVDTVGGGICQTSSTVYLAALLSNLEIVERYNHRYWPGYITLGMDATVSWGGPEFRFRNNTGYPIRIDVVYKDSQITVSIYGTKTDDTYVEMTREVLSTTSYDTEYVETDELPYGTEKQKQNGYTGYVVQTYRNVYNGDGTLLSSTPEAKSNYSSRNQIILVGTAGRPETETPLPPDTGGDGETDSGQEEPVLPPSDGGSVETGGDAGLGGETGAGEDTGAVPPEEPPPGWL